MITPLLSLSKVYKCYVISRYLNYKMASTEVLQVQVTCLINIVQLLRNSQEKKGEK